MELSGAKPCRPCLLVPLALWRTESIPEASGGKGLIWFTAPVLSVVGGEGPAELLPHIRQQKWVVEAAHITERWAEAPCCDALLACRSPKVL